MAFQRGPRGSGIMGPGGDCVCPKCGKKVRHEYAEPCRQVRCPDCGTAMVREGSPHHETLQG
ncbi:MAG: ferredoxin [marine benthic group bacterium]|nr:ferredoxin [Gemmatimonadota bacterium]